MITERYPNELFSIPLMKKVLVSKPDPDSELVESAANALPLREGRREVVGSGDWNKGRSFGSAGME